MMGYSLRTDLYCDAEGVYRGTHAIRYRELYDVTSDPLCKESVVVKPEHEKLLAELHAMTEAGWRDAVPR